MNISIRLFTNSTTEDAARQVSFRLLEYAAAFSEKLFVHPYLKGGFEVRTEMMLAAKTWPEFVLESLTMAQAMGHGWILHGDISSEVDAWCNSSKVSGVTSIHVFATKAFDG